MYRPYSVSQERLKVWALKDALGEAAEGLNHTRVTRAKCLSYELLMAEWQMDKGYLHQAAFRHRNKNYILNYFFRCKNIDHHSSFGFYFIQSVIYQVGRQLVPKVL